MVNLLDGELFARGEADAVFAQLRRETPVMWHGNFWAVLRHGDVIAVMGDPETFTSSRGTGFVSRLDAAPAPPTWRSLNGSDGAVHAELRSLVERAVGAPRDTMWLRARARELVDALVERGGGDVVRDLAEQLPIEALARLLGIDGAQREALRACTQAIARHADASQRPAEWGPGEAFADGERALRRLVADWIDARAGRPPADTIGRLLAASDAAGLPRRDLAYLLRLIALTGHHSTALAIAGAAHALATHPDQAARLAANAPLGPAVDEVLRWTSPIVRFGRFVERDATIGGQTIRRGERVVAFFRSANFDETVFAAPERFDLTRVSNPHVAFGYGPHTCFGAGFARMQLAAAIDALRHVELALAEPPVRLASSVSSGFLELRVTAQRR